MVQEAKFYETYYFCNVIRNVLHDQFEYLRNLHEFYGDDGHFYLIKPFQRYSSFHRFIEFIVDSVYHESAASVDLEDRKLTISRFSEVPEALADFRSDQLPIELALNFHGIEHSSFVSFLSERRKDFQRSDLDDVYEYMSDIRDSGAYEKLIDQTVKEVFHVLFQNRELMLLFNEMIAAELGRRADDPIPNDFLHIEHLFSNRGVLERKPIPKWVQRAVFFRDRGRCVLCDKDLSGTLNFQNVENYDHIVPLARHGLNDISNIQLLCKECNQSEKRAGNPITSGRYQSWYEYDET